MGRWPGSRYGRAALVGVLIALLLTIGAGVYLVAARLQATAETAAFADEPAAQRHQVTQLQLLMVLLGSTLVLLLFVVACYLMMRLGRAVSAPIAGAPTEYVDVWQKYRLTEDQITAATMEDDDEPEVPPSSGDDPDEPPMRE